MILQKKENSRIAKAKGAVFISQIGKELASGEKHDGRAPDYDDWELNGDIIVYYPVLGHRLWNFLPWESALMKSALKKSVETRRLRRTPQSLPFQKALLNGELPYTVGGGIGQSRICMYYLRKAHIGEVQSSIWPEEVVEQALANGIQLL